MHSPASLSDLETEDNDEEYRTNNDEYVAYSSSRSSSSYISDNNTTSDGDSDVAVNSCRVREFGDFEENYGWTQCRSKSFPNRIYYYNTHSGCSTWYRPISRFIDLPFVSIKRVNTADNVLESANDLDLMTVSDDEQEKKAPGHRRKRERDLAKSLIGVADVIERYYDAPHISEIPDVNDTRSSIDEDADERQEEKPRMGDENNDAEDVACSPLYAANFLETELFVGKDTVDTEGYSRMFSSSLMKENARLSSTRCGSVVYGVPRLKRIRLESQLVKQRRTRVSREPAGPRRIISDMYGVRTISYDLPVSNHQPCKVEWFATTTLSASDTDSVENVPRSPSRRETKPLWSFKSDIGRNLRQPLLSESSSSPSSRSDTSSSSSCGSSCSCSCSSRSRSNSRSSSSSGSNSSSGSSSSSASPSLSGRKI